LQDECRGALGRSGLDPLTRAHLESLAAIAQQALSAQVIASP